MRTLILGKGKRQVLLHPPIAQLEERKTVTGNVYLDVAGSIPARRILGMGVNFYLNT